MTDAQSTGYAWQWSGSGWVKAAGATWRNPGFNQSDANPVTCVSWRDAMAFAEWLNRNENTTGYRLPTEVEWEYAARAGTGASRYWGDDPSEACRYANVGDQAMLRYYRGWPAHSCDDGYVHTSPASAYLPNHFGLYDMLGNVWEWCMDVYQNQPELYRSFRGGCWFRPPATVRAAFRGAAPPHFARYDLGFRLVKEE